MTAVNAMAEAHSAAEPVRAHLRVQIQRLEHAAEAGHRFDKPLCVNLANELRAHLRDLTTAPGGWQTIAGLTGLNGGRHGTDNVNAAIERAMRVSSFDGVVLTRDQAADFQINKRRAA